MFSTLDVLNEPLRSSVFNLCWFYLDSSFVSRGASLHLSLIFRVSFLSVIVFKLIYEKGMLEEIMIGAIFFYFCLGVFTIYSPVYIEKNTFLDDF